MTRYGFHGTSHDYVVRRVASILVRAMRSLTKVFVNKTQAGAFVIWTRLLPRLRHMALAHRR